MGCTLLLKLANALKDVAKANIILPLNRVFHDSEMPHSVHRVEVLRPLPGCEELDPPNQPAGEDEELKVGQLKNRLLLWPKALIRLNPTTESVPSQDRVGIPPVDDHQEATAHQQHNFSPIDAFLNDLDMEIDPLPRGSSEHRDFPVKRLFGSQETPEEATQPSLLLNLQC